MSRRPVRTLRGSLCALAGAAAVLAGCTSVDGREDEESEQPDTVTLAFAGDVHFQRELARTARADDSTLGPLSRQLASADVAMVNLETAVTRRRDRADKELEDPSARYWFKAPVSALGVLQRSGVDVASMANNHGADYGVAGVRDSVRAGRDSDLDLIGIGDDADAAFTPFRTRVRDTDVAIHAADASPLESRDDVWSARPGSGPGIADARGEGRERLLRSVRESAARDDVVAVYLHWGSEGSAEPTRDQRRLGRQLAQAGADVIVGSHAHVPLGAGSLADGAYVSYGLGNFFWYHGDNAETGVLKVTVRDGQVVKDAWKPGVIPKDGGPARALTGSRAETAAERWRGLRSRTDLAALPETSAGPPTDLPAFASSVARIDATTRSRMTAHDEGTCPVPLADLRLVRVSYVGFDGFAHRGELVLDADVATDVVSVFDELYRERFPLQSMRLIDTYDGDDDRSMAANNSSAYNCRRVAGSSSWSAHAYGRAVDINPVQNPYVVDGRALPPGSQPFVDVDRTSGSEADRGVITADGVVVRAFRRIGWTWGADFDEPDYQHFAAPDPRAR